MTNLIRAAVLRDPRQRCLWRLDIDVSSTTLKSISVGMTLTSHSKGLQLVAMGRYSSGPARNFTDGVDWVSSNPAVATVSALGLLTNVGDGATTVTATYQAKSGSLTLIFPLVTSVD
jgi:hypothetical protein